MTICLILSVITALAGLLGAITMAANYFGLSLTFADNLVLMSILPLFIGLLLKSRISVLTTILATLGWGALIFTSGGEISGAAALFPLILAGQVYTATHIKSGLAILLSVITAYYWGLSLILTFWTADNLPLTFAASVIFIVGMAHYRCGKASEDKLITGSAIHIYFGWTAATVGIIGFQYLLLTPEALRNTTATLSVILNPDLVTIDYSVIFLGALLTAHSRDIAANMSGPGYVEARIAFQ